MFFSFTDISLVMGTENLRRVCTSGTVEEKGTLVVRGPSGSGKTTLLRTLARLRPSQQGQVFLQGKNWTEFSGPVWRSKVHYLAQRPVMFNGTVADNLAKPFELGLLSREGTFDAAAARERLMALGLPKDIWDQDTSTLSGGEISRVAFVRALAAEPKVLLLDEPTAALDHETAQAFYSLLAQWLQLAERACILVSHNEDYHSLMPEFIDLQVKEEGI
jgi:putative ABC transport system ATP-binding protein